MVDAATGLPAAPAPFTESGADPLSAAIRDKLPAIEDPIQAALPKLKAEATKTANNIVTAAGHYARTDEQLAADYDEHRFDGVSPSAAGSAGSGGTGGAAGSMSQLMGMPMQIAGQVAQVPTQALGALASVPQGVMQGVQQFSGMGGGTGKSPDRTDLSDRPRHQEERDEEKRRDRREGAAAGDPNGDRAPVLPQTEVGVPQRNSGRHAAPDPSIDV
jgi:hypothetical protein